MGWEVFSPPSCSDQLWDPPNLLSSGYQGALSLGVKRLVREGDHSPPSVAEVKNAWKYTSTLLIHREVALVLNTVS